MLKSGSGFDEVSAYMHCLVMMTTLQEEHQKVWNFSLSLKEENTIFIDTLLDHTVFMCSC